MKIQSQEAQSFLAHFSDKSYTDIFNIRSRIEQKEWERFAITDAKRVLLSKENAYPSNKNVLYIHIPFCATRCDYCPYFTSTYSKALLDEYLVALNREMDEMRATPFVSSTRFSSLYFGGGTPSLMSSDTIAQLTERVFKGFTFEAGAELSFEANAGTLTNTKIRALAEAGINRVSLGVQTFSPRLLAEMNCGHTPQKVLEVVGELHSYNIRTNLDCIFGLIGQTQRELEADLDILCAIGTPFQLTYFPLRIAERTPLHRELERNGNDCVAPRDHNARLLAFDNLVEKRLSERGFVREECPCFYHSGGETAHKYHSTETRVIGIGSSAGTLLDAGESSNFYDVQQYIHAMATGEDPALSGIMLNQRQAHERFVLYRILYMNRSLPNFEDVLAERFREYYGTSIGGTYRSVINDMIAKRFITLDGDRIMLTDRMWRILNKVKIGMPSIL